MIDDVSRAKIVALKNHAEDNPLNYNDLKDTVALVVCPRGKRIKTNNR